MRRLLFGLALLACVAAASAGGYWFGRKQENASSQLNIAAAPAQAAERKVLYYRNPMGQSDTSLVPKKDSMGMDYIPVYAGEDASASAQVQPARPSSSTGKIRFYRNPMGLSDTSPVPKKDSMGMDYIPVYEGDEPDDGSVKISPARVQKLGVRSEAAEMRNLARTIRAVGSVQADERGLFVVNTKFEGYIDKLHVNTTGEQVRRGEPLMEVYAPELVAAEQEYLLALRSYKEMGRAGNELRASARQLADAALQRLRNWDISDDQIKQLQRSGKVTRTLTLRAPTDGVVMEKMAVEGTRFMPGEPLYRIADLSTVWLIADVFEQDLGMVREGQDAKVTVNAYPGVVFPGKVDFIYPTVMQDTRTGRVRVTISNTDGRLKTGMYGNVALAAAVGTGPVLTVQDSAVIDSGTRQIVLVERGEGKFEPREVKLGAHADGFYEIRDGLKTDERVVVSANFLIDAESNLKAALKSFTSPDPSGITRPSTSAGTAGGKS